MRRAQMKFIVVTLIILMFVMAFSGVYQPTMIEESIW